MDAGLYDVLRGQFYDGTPLPDVPQKDQRLKSVLSNLNRLFNTRRGALPHMPEYGLPEAAIIYRDAQYPLEELRKNIREAVENYEPRLRRVRVDRQPDADDSNRIAFLISGELQNGDRVRLQTKISTNDLVQVSPLAHRD